VFPDLGGGYVLILVLQLFCLSLYWFLDQNKDNKNVASQLSTWSVLSFCLQNNSI
jgi:hypothetical protein